MTGLVILDLLPSRMDVNGDRGNVIALVRRLAWAGIESTVVTGDDPRWWRVDPDLVHVSGPTAAGQRASLEFVGDRYRHLHEWAAAGVPVLGVAGGFHLLLDHVHLPGTEVTVPGFGLLHGFSRPAPVRTSGFAVVDVHGDSVLGYHNLGQEAVLTGGTLPWGWAVVGGGNVRGAPAEGAVDGPVLGTNLNGPLLPRNPRVADRLLVAAATRRGLDYVPGERHLAVDVIARRANAVLRARAAATRTATFATAKRPEQL